MQKAYLVRNLDDTNAVRTVLEFSNQKAALKAKTVFESENEDNWLLLVPAKEQRKKVKRKSRATKH